MNAAWGFGKILTLRIITMQEDSLPVYDIDGLGLGIIFKHPATRFDTEAYQSWDL